MRTLKLFILSVIYGQPVAFLTDFLLFRMARALSNLSEARDLSRSISGSNHNWDHLLMDQGRGDPDDEEEHDDEAEDGDEIKEDRKNYPTSIWKKREA